MRAIIQTPTPNLTESIDFYKKLKFEIFSESAPAQVTDGKVVIEINPDRFARAGVKLFKESWKEEVKSLKKTAVISKSEEGYFLTDGTGSYIYLIENEPVTDFQPKGDCFSTLGNFAGLSLETSNIDRTAEIYQILGFKKTMGSAEQGWMAFENADGLSVSLMKPMSCPHLFFNPSLTYFNGKEGNPVAIEKIRKAGIQITEEITAFNKEGIVDNVIIRDPGGLGFFIFND